MQEETSNIILGIAGKSDSFVLRYGWFKFKLKIKPLSAKKLIEISKEISKLGTIDQAQDMFPALLKGSTDLIYISNAITIATGTKWKRIVSKAILDLDLKDIKILFSIVHKQSDPAPFFFTIILAKGRMNLLNAKDEQ